MLDCGAHEQMESDNFPTLCWGNCLFLSPQSEGRIEALISPLYILYTTPGVIIDPLYHGYRTRGANEPLLVSCTPHYLKLKIQIWRMPWGFKDTDCASWRSLVSELCWLNIHVSELCWHIHDNTYMFMYVQYYFIQWAVLKIDNSSVFISFLFRIIS